MRKIAEIILLVSFLAPELLATQCYQCVAGIGENTDCELNVTRIQPQNCSNDFVCIKYIITVGESKNLSRLCSSADQCNVIKATNAHVITNRTVDFCETCDTDFCNSAESHFSSFFVISLSFLTIFTKML